MQVVYCLNWISLHQWLSMYIQAWYESNHAQASIVMCTIERSPYWIWTLVQPKYCANSMSTHVHMFVTAAGECPSLIAWIAPLILFSIVEPLVMPSYAVKWSAYLVMCACVHVAGYEHVAVCIGRCKVNREWNLCPQTLSLSTYRPHNLECHPSDS